MCFRSKTWNLIGKPPYGSLANNGVKPRLFKIRQLKWQKLLKSCWPSETENWLRWVVYWKNFVRIATHSKSHLWNIAKSTRKGEFHPCAIFSTRPCWEMDIMPDVNFALSSNNKHQLTDLYNYLNKKSDNRH